MLDIKKCIERWHANLRSAFHEAARPKASIPLHVLATNPYARAYGTEMVTETDLAVPYLYIFRCDRVTKEAYSEAPHVQNNRPLLERLDHIFGKTCFDAFPYMPPFGGEEITIVSCKKPGTDDVWWHLATDEPSAISLRVMEKSIELQLYDARHPQKKAAKLEGAALR